MTAAPLISSHWFHSLDLGLPVPNLGQVVQWSVGHYWLSGDQLSQFARAFQGHGTFRAETRTRWLSWLSKGEKCLTPKFRGHCKHHRFVPVPWLKSSECVESLASLAQIHCPKGVPLVGRVTGNEPSSGAKTEHLN